MIKFNSKVLIVALAVLVAATAIFTALRGGKDNTIGGGIQIFESEHKLSEDMQPISVDEDSPFYDVFKDKDRVNVLLLGVNEGMTDVIMVFSYDMQNQFVNIISVPRDTYFYRPGKESNYANFKINAIYRSEGAVKLAEAVSSILYGMPMHYYGVVEYEDIRKVMDVIGGIEVDIPSDMDYDDPTAKPPLHIHIKKGRQIIDRSNVEEYLRFRSGYSNADIGRIQVHQEFVKKVIRECLRMGNILDVAKVALENIESDVTYDVAIKVATRAGGLSSERINSYILPGNDTSIKGLSFWQPSQEGINDVMAEIYAIGSGTSADIAFPKEFRSLEKPTVNRDFLPKGGTVIDIEFDKDGNVVEQNEPPSGSN